MERQNKGLEVVPQETRVECPNCKFLYMSGSYIIKLSVYGEESILGQDKDESHECSNFKEIINGGDTLALCAVFETLGEAMEKAYNILMLMVNDYSKFTNVVVLYDNSFFENMESN